MTCRHEFVKVAHWPVKKNRRYLCRLCGEYTRRYDGVDQMSMRPIHRMMSVAFRGMNVVEKDGLVPLCHHNYVRLPLKDNGGYTNLCLRCGERND